MKVFLRIFYGFFFLVLVLNSAFSLWDSYSVDVEDLPVGQYCRMSASPDKRINLRIYKLENSLGNAVRVEAVTSAGRRNIYWQVGTASVNINWVDASVANINGTLIDVANGGFYDCRRDRYIFSIGSKTEE